MKQLVVIILLLMTIFILASVDKRKKISGAKLLKNGIVLSSALCAVTLIIWLVSLFCFEWRLDFPAGQNHYCEIGFFVGTVEICVTRYDGDPVIVEHYEPNDSHRPDADLNYMPPKGMKFYSRWIDLPEGYPRLFKWFKVEQENPRDECHFTFVEISYWFIALLTAIPFAVWRVRKKLKYLP